MLFWWYNYFGWFLNSVDGKDVMNHVTLDGLTPAQAEVLFKPIELNPVPKEQRGISCNGK
ncbi:hypothetical protein [Phocaeicola sp.]